MKNPKVFLCLILMFPHCVSEPTRIQQFCPQGEEVPKTILTNLLTNYDKNMIPSHKGVDVHMEIAIQSFAEVSEISSSFSADVLFGEIWIDENLKFSQLAPCLSNLTLGHGMVDSLWLPNVCFVNRLVQFPSTQTFLGRKIDHFFFLKS